MAAYGRPSLRDLFDESPTPHIAHPPRSHHRDSYIATDGSFRPHNGTTSPDSEAASSTGGLGVVVETLDGERVVRLSVPDTCPDNNVAEYRALHLGLDVLARRAPPNARVGLLIDHDQLAENVNAEVLASHGSAYDPPHSVSVPPATGLHWRGIQARINGFGEVRAARISGDRNPAHPLANAPDQYAHVNGEPDRCVLPDAPTVNERVPPPSRAERGGASD
ncbi:ribonuclease H [Haloarcula sp. Atlit-47R]|uniref:ribonuclease H n=1 Tax=Haloarcula sp. Atlit-47R TaxID=2282132 RepID=UPI000EF29160|nr:ribonuclease H [Haloarcula sp. Atlit-47R]RLM47302.1 ribonuclease H [Haloarcula sp. Atlit-47R]